MPSQKRIELRKIDEYIIIASDGVWDALRPHDVLDILNEGKSVKETSIDIVAKSIKGGSMDNISCIIAKL